MEPLHDVNESQFKQVFSTIDCDFIMKHSNMQLDFVTVFGVRTAVLIIGKCAPKVTLSTS